MSLKALLAPVAAALALALAADARADLNVGVIVSTTGPGASLGIPEQNTARLWPTEIAGQKVNLTILNDESDTTAAGKAATRLVTEHRSTSSSGPR